jgi:hypothetical protein
MFLCPPALLYFLLGMLGIIIIVIQIVKTPSSQNKSFYIDLVSRIFVVCLISYILNYVCNHYSTTTSWYALAIMYLLPIVLGIITFLFIVLSNKQGNINNILNKSLKSTKDINIENITKTLSKTIKKNI